MLSIKEWERLEKIGEGAYGEVYRIQNPETKEICALKIIRVPKDDTEADHLRTEYPDHASRREYLKNTIQVLIREIELMKSLHGHKNIVSLEDYLVEEFHDEVGWTIYIRMEFLTSFSDYFSEHKNDESEIIRMGIDVCSALEECDRLKIIHRDIKPDNILVSDDGIYKLADFGIARNIEKTMTVMTKRGTYAFMAPEIFHGEKYGKNVDIYSLGIMLYRLCNNNRDPFISADKKIVYFRDREAAMEKRMTGEVMPAPSKASEQLAEIILKACAYRPDNRYVSAEEMKRDLEMLRDGKYRLRNREYISEEEQKQIEEERKQLELESQIAKNTSKKWRKIAVILSSLSCIILIGTIWAYWLDKTAVVAEAVPYIANVSTDDIDLAKLAERKATLYEGWLWECMAEDDYDKYAADDEYGIVPKNMFDILKLYYYKPELTGRKNETHFIQQAGEYYQIETMRYFVDGYYGSEDDFSEASVDQTSLQWKLKYDSTNKTFVPAGESEVIALNQAVLSLYPEGFQDAVNHDRYYMDSGQMSSILGDMVYEGVFNYSAVALWEDENGLLNALISIKNGTKEEGILKSIELSIVNEDGDDIILSHIDHDAIVGSSIIEPLNNDNYVITNISLEDSELTIEDMENSSSYKVNAIINE